MTNPSLELSRVILLFWLVTATIAAAHDQTRSDQVLQQAVRQEIKDYFRIIEFRNTPDMEAYKKFLKNRYEAMCKLGDVLYRAGETGLVVFEEYALDEIKHRPGSGWEDMSGNWDAYLGAACLGRPEVGRPRVNALLRHPGISQAARLVILRSLPFGCSPDLWLDEEAALPVLALALDDTTPNGGVAVCIGEEPGRQLDLRNCDWAAGLIAEWYGPEGVEAPIALVQREGDHRDASVAAAKAWLAGRTLRRQARTALLDLLRGHRVVGMSPEKIDGAFVLWQGLRDDVRPTDLSDLRDLCRLLVDESAAGVGAGKPDETTRRYRERLASALTTAFAAVKATVPAPGKQEFADPVATLSWIRAALTAAAQAETFYANRRKWEDLARQFE
jgi:hypothetical protein